MSARHVLELCDRWDALSKGETPTTAAIRAALAVESTGRRRCHETGCRHSPSAHTEAGCRSCHCTRWLDHKRHAWREGVCESWFLATHAWWLEREAFAVGNRTEQAEFEQARPRPRLGDHMQALSYGARPEQVAS